MRDSTFLFDIYWDSKFLRMSLLEDDSPVICGTLSGSLCELDQTAVQTPHSDVAGARTVWALRLGPAGRVQLSRA